MLQLETVLLSLYYPSALGSGNGKDPGGHKHWSREVWLPHPRSEMSKGYAAFAQLPQWLIIIWFFMTTWFTKLPAFRNAMLASHWPPEQNARQGGWKVKNKMGEPPSGQTQEPIFPLIMFSHGMGGSRTAYSTVCGEFASYGFVVCAVEHRDGSGARTFINHPPEGKGSRKEREMNGDVDHWDTELKHGWDVVDFVFPKQNPYDTRPSNEQGIDKELRAAQLDMRLAEIEEAYDIVKAIAAGNGPAVAEQNLRNKDGIGCSSRGTSGVDWKPWTGRVSTTGVTMVGHSFGAATTIEILRDATRFHWVGQSIIYDLWGLSLKSPDSESRHRISAPLLGINSEAFMYWEDNFRAAVQVCDEAKENGSLAWLLTVRGTVHISQSDFCILYPHVASLMLKQTMNPRRAIDINVTASLEFLAQVMPQPIAPFHRCLESEKILGLPCIQELPTEHKPAEKWTAVRLKVPHETRSRIVPSVRRKLKKYGGTKGEEHEVWMHLAPSAEELKSKLISRDTKHISDLSVADSPNSKGFVAAITPVWPVGKGD